MMYAYPRKSTNHQGKKSFILEAKKKCRRPDFDGAGNKLKKSKTWKDVLSLSWLWGKTEFQRLESARKGSI
jgi:hypothetical protein